MHDVEAHTLLHAMNVTLGELCEEMRREGGTLLFLNLFTPESFELLQRTSIVKFFNVEKVFSLHKLTRFIPFAQ